MLEYTYIAALIVWVLSATALTLKEILFEPIYEDKITDIIVKTFKVFTVLLFFPCTLFMAAITFA